MGKSKAAQAEIDARAAECRDMLRGLLPIGAEVPVYVADVSRDGMARTLVVLAPETRHDGAPSVRNVSGMVAAALGWKYDDKRNGVRVGGAGMDMAFHLVYSLARVLYRDDMPGEDAGYALNVRHL